jgi:hypothetical protein
LAALAALWLSGCLYRVDHRLPLEASFGAPELASGLRTPFHVQRTKSYLLGGTIPWSLSYGGSKSLVDAMPGRRVECLRISTRFTPLDALLRFVPYVSYLLARRTVVVDGVYVDTTLDPVPPPEDGVASETGPGASPIP